LTLGTALAVKRYCPLEKSASYDAAFRQNFLTTFGGDDRQGVCGYFVYCLFVLILSFCTVTDFSGQDKDSSVKFCTVVPGRPGQGISHFGELCSPRSPKSDESASHREVVFIWEGTPQTSR